MQNPATRSPLVDPAGAEQPAPASAAAGTLFQPLARTLYRYPIPKKHQLFVGDGVQSIGLVALTAEEEIQGAERAGSNPTRVAPQLMKAALREVNGQAVGLHDNSADTWLERMHPRTRALVASAYATIHQPQEEDVQGFLAGVEVVASR